MAVQISSRLLRSTAEMLSPYGGLFVPQLYHLSGTESRMTQRGGHVISIARDGDDAAGG
jgi:hypothetical protein